MFKDVLVNLSVAHRRDPACDYAVSVANAFNAHLSGIAFAYDPAVPAIAGGCEVMLPGWIEEERGKAAERAKAAVAKFEAAARREGLSAESRVLNATARKAPHLFAQIARRFDLSLVQQSDPEQPGHENVIITAALFELRSTSADRSLHSDRRHSTEPCHDLLGRQSQRRARYRGRAALSHARESHRASDRRLC